MIFRPEIFLQEPKLDYPVFLFCEEIFMAEMALRIGKKVTHCPSVKVWDKEHASTGLMNLWRYCKYNHDALSYIIRTFYEQD
jgi:GT2 family glycosyltransferase